MKIMNIRKKDVEEKYNVGNIFKPFVVKRKIIEWIQDWFERNGKDCNAVIGISGGKDSTIVAALCVEALGKDRVIGVLMPNGEDEDLKIAREVIKELGIQSYEINIDNTVSSIINSLKFSNNIKISTQTKINLPPRIRMSILFAVAQSLNGRVIGTANLSETVVGYYTLGGDSVSAMFPIRDLTVTEVQLIGKALNLPNHMIYKTPTDGLCGKTDEDNLGFTYEVLDKYIRTGICENEEIRCKIEQMAGATQFKLQPSEIFKTELMNYVKHFNEYE